MKIQQISIFLENATGRMAEVTRILKDGGINLRAIMVADTADFGILRIIADNPEKAIEILHNANFTTKTTSVLAVTVRDEGGSLASVLGIFEKNGMNIEYLYSFVLTNHNTAKILMRVEDTERAVAMLQQKGIKLLSEKIL